MKISSKLLVVLTGKTAAGKDSVMARLLIRFPDFKRVVTTTSRKIRAGEQNGVDYNFISETDFRQKIAEGDFIEYVEYGSNFYGTEKIQLTDTSQGLIWRIDPSRAGKIRELINTKVLVIYLTVDDTVVLQRLKKRGLSQEEIDRRMQEDAKFWQEFRANYDFVVENVPGKLDETVNQVCNLIRKRLKYTDHEDFTSPEAK